ncbi:MAG: aminopeptidase N, partial [Pseudomonadales bacterium]|nr:aminopeptidase N [Pseudomonadales bacterium]NIX09546.1 aminopeptidase N [Pseudomonadales bacterium]
MSSDVPEPVYLQGYEPPAYRTVQTRLSFDIRDGFTRVESQLTVERRADSTDGSLRLDGRDLELVSVAVDGRSLGGNEFLVDAESLTLFDLPPRCEITIVTLIEPEKNTALEGLYKSGSMYCTQCEAEGFRRITYYQDRPDVLSRFTTTLEADASRYPVLLANGNLTTDVPVDSGRRRVTWDDPFPKPSYLFALVAGDLSVMEDEFVTASGRRVALQIFSEPHNIGQCGYAMEALKRAMRWDEETFGREYDLDVFMIVAVEDFNMGAMENKGLNIFNTKCVLASPDTATDAAYLRVEGVVAHEYFHNWSGNRVTCRDWFQLSLKEGFTVFRDAEFSSDMNFRAVKRIEDVNFLRSFQFPEDAGPMAHPVRPDSYIEISNFYTTTVYEKGSEVVRMLRTMLGDERFRRGSDLFFDRHDGSAATTDDFLAAMADVTALDLQQFQRWYEQAGTPRLEVEEDWRDGELSLR